MGRDEPGKIERDSSKTKRVRRRTRFEGGVREGLRKD